MGSWITRISNCSGAVLVLLLSVATLRAEPVHLVEIIYELDLAPFETGEFPQQYDERGDASGYVILPSIAGTPGMFYQALDVPIPETFEIGLWAARRFRNRLVGPSGDAKTLEPVGGLPWSPDFDTVADLAPKLSLSVTDIADGMLTLESNGEVYHIQAGSQAHVAQAEREVSADEFVDSVLAAYSAAGVAELPAREAVLREIGFLPSEDGVFTFHGRLLVRNHGAAELADVDLAALWREAQRLAEEGPYEDALTSFETLLDVLPNHARAARLFHEVLDLVETGAVAAHAMGTVTFPEGQPDERALALWDSWHAGFAMFAVPDDPPGAARVVLPVRDGTFATHLPAGIWRLTVEIPGFETFEREILLDGETEIDVQLVERR